MRTLGIVVILLGAVIAYLGWKGKIPAAWEAILTGKAPASGAAVNTKGAAIMSGDLPTIGGLG